MKNIFLILQMLLAIILVVMIFMQSRGTGFARSWGGGTSSFTRRGLEKFIFKATFIVSALFILVSFFSITL